MVVARLGVVQPRAVLRRMSNQAKPGMCDGNRGNGARCESIARFLVSSRVRHYRACSDHLGQVVDHLCPPAGGVRVQRLP